LGLIWTGSHVKLTMYVKAAYYCPATAQLLS